MPTRENMAPRGTNVVARAATEAATAALLSIPERSRLQVARAMFSRFKEDVLSFAKGGAGKGGRGAAKPAAPSKGGRGGAKKGGVKKAGARKPGRPRKITASAEPVETQAFHASSSDTPDTSEF